jgi:DNA-directed RNA polymerase specialized sigma subunit
MRWSLGSWLSGEPPQPPIHAAYTRSVGTRPVQEKVDPEGEEERARLAELVAEYPPLDEAETARLLSQVGDSGLDADPRRQLVHHHLWVVRDQAVAASGPATSPGDLFQDGTTALLKLVHGLAPGTTIGPTEFLAQVREGVATAIAAALEEETRAREHDAERASDAERLFAADMQLKLENGAEPTDRELATHLGWTEERVEQLRPAVNEAAAQHDAEVLATLNEIEEEEE